MNAYQAAGIEVTDYTYVFQEIDRTFSVIVSEGATKAALEVRLGRTNNTQDFFAIVAMMRKVARDWDARITRAASK